MYYSVRTKLDYLLVHFLSGFLIPFLFYFFKQRRRKVRESLCLFFFPHFFCFDSLNHRHAMCWCRVNPAGRSVCVAFISPPGGGGLRYCRVCVWLCCWAFLCIAIKEEQPGEKSSRRRRRRKRKQMKMQVTANQQTPPPSLFFWSL